MNSVRNIPKRREVWVDILKGVMIIAVVIGHSNFEYTQYIYWFHMPIFFILSGFIFNPSKTNNMWRFSMQTVIKYMIPFIIWWIITSILLGSFSLHRLLYAVWGGRLLGGVYWYINCLVLTVILFAWLLKIKQKKCQFLIMMLIYCAAIMESNLINSYRTVSGLPVALCFPWNIDVVLLSIVYYAMGFYWNQLSDYIYRKNWHRIVFIVSIIVPLIYIVFNISGRYSFFIDMKNSDYKSFFLTILIPFCFFWLFSRLSKYLEKIVILRNFLAYIGTISIIIMYTHITVREIIVEKIWGEDYNVMVFIVISAFVAYLIDNVAKRNTRLYFLLTGKGYSKLL